MLKKDELFKIGANIEDSLSRPTCFLVRCFHRWVRSNLCAFLPSPCFYVEISRETSDPIDTTSDKVEAVVRKRSARSPQKELRRSHKAGREEGEKEGGWEGKNG